MEEEYRNQRPGEATSSSTTAAGSTMSKSAADNDDNASIKAIPPTPGSEGGIGDETFDSSGDKSIQDGMSNLGLNAGANSSSHSIPTIKISTESDHERERAKIADYVQEAGAGKTAEEDATGGSGQAVEVTPPPLEKPAQAQAGAQHGRTDSVATVHGASTGVDVEQQQAQQADSSTRDEQPASGFPFTNKRLCERWLDNLFMVLYEDLRVYTIWRAELAHYKAQSLPYRKTGTEWEILGELALRLHHKEEAKDAFQRCIEAKFSAKGYLRLLESYVEAKDVQRSLWMSLRLTAYNHRWYSEGSYPGAVATNLFKLIKTEGLAKVSYTLVSMSPPNSILKLSEYKEGFVHLTGLSIRWLTRPRFASFSAKSFCVRTNIQDPRSRYLAGGEVIDTKDGQGKAAAGQQKAKRATSCTFSSFQSHSMLRCQGTPALRSYTLSERAPLCRHGWRCGWLRLETCARVAAVPCNAGPRRVHAEQATL